MAELSEAEWREKLSPEQHCAQARTECFTGKYDKHYDEGDIEGLCQFESEDKYNSGCGWPAARAAEGEAVDEHRDTRDDPHRSDRIAVATWGMSSPTDRAIAGACGIASIRQRSISNPRIDRAEQGHARSRPVSSRHARVRLL